MNEKLRLAPERHDLITCYSLHLFSVEVHTNCFKIMRHSGKLSVHACNTREILRAQRNKNYIIFMMTLSWQNYDIFKIPIAYFQFAGISSSQNRYGYRFQKKLLSKPPLSPISLKEKNLRFIYHTLPLFRPDRHSGKSIAHVLLPNFLNSFLNNLSNNFVKLN